MESKSTSKSGKTIKLRGDTLEKLEKLRHQGQTYDGIVAELIEFFEKHKRKAR